MARYSRLDYTSRDYDSFREELIALAAVLFPDWTDFGPGNPGMAILESLAWTLDQMSYYQDREVNEAFLVTAVERKNVIKHLRGIGYELATRSPASVDLTLSLDSPLAQGYTVPALTQVTTVDGATSGEIMEDVALQPGSSGAVATAVPWLAGQTFQESLGTSDGTPRQRFVLGRTPFLLMPAGAVGAESVSFDGVQWTRVTDFLSSTSTDLHYTVQVDDKDVATITVGDGVNGAIPASGASGSCTYRVGGGSVDNVDAGTLTRLPRQLITASGLVVPLTITNPLAASGGAERETVAHAKQYGPASLKTLSRSVCKEDYEINAQAVPGVARALALTSSTTGSAIEQGIEQNTVIVYIVPVGGGTASQALLDAVTAQLTTTFPRAATTRLNVYPAPYCYLGFACTVYVSKLSDPTAQAALLNSVAAAVQAALLANFDPSSLDTVNGGWTANFGELVPLSKIYRLLQRLADVSRTTVLSYPPSDVAVPYPQFPALTSTTPTPVQATSTSQVATLTFPALGGVPQCVITVQPEPA